MSRKSGRQSWRQIVRSRANMHFQEPEEFCRLLVKTPSVRGQGLIATLWRMPTQHKIQGFAQDCGSDLIATLWRMPTQHCGRMR